MTTFFRSFWRVFARQDRRDTPAPQTVDVAQQRRAATPTVDIAPGDPIIAYFQSAPGAVEIDKLDLPSPALRALQAAGVKMAVPLVSQGELIGVLNLGPRLSEQDYSVDDRVLLTNLATQAAPALRVAQLVREQQADIRARERIEHEMRVARHIQQSLLPKELPALSGWQVAAHYQPARAVGGDFYDFLTLPDGRCGIVIGDVTDKGVPAALVMATTRSTLRATAQQLVSPGLVLEKVNDQLCPEFPPNMFVTCLYAVLDPTTGRLQYANAGHDLPYRRCASGIEELRARGMPLGLMQGMQYEEKETILDPGESVLLYSDGLVEAHDPQREMFGFPRLRQLMADLPDDSSEMVTSLLSELQRFTGADWEQEDDLTLVVLQRAAAASTPEAGDSWETVDGAPAHGQGWRRLAEWTVPSEPGNERLVMDEIVAAVAHLHMSARSLERLKTAVAEATMNAMEHGNEYRPDLPVQLEVLASDSALSVRITDQGGSKPIPDPETPNLEDKLAGLQSPRGWGLFLIKNLVDEMHVSHNDTHHTIDLIMHLEGGHDADQAA